MSCWGNLRARWGALSRIEAKVDMVLIALDAERQREDQIMATLDELSQAVSEESTLVDSLGTFIQGLRDQIAALPGIPADAQAKIDSIFSQVQSNKTKIAGDMVTNTPAADVPVDQPPTS